MLIQVLTAVVCEMKVLLSGMNLIFISAIELELR